MALKIPFSEKLTLVGVANWVVECGKGLPGILYSRCISFMGLGLRFSGIL